MSASKFGVVVVVVARVVLPPLVVPVAVVDMFPVRSQLLQAKPSPSMSVVAVRPGHATPLVVVEVVEHIQVFIDRQHHSPLLPVEVVAVVVAQHQPISVAQVVRVVAQQALQAAHPMALIPVVAVEHKVQVAQQELAVIQPSPVAR